MIRALYKIGSLQISGSADPLTNVVDQIQPRSYLISIDLKTDDKGEIYLINPDKPFNLSEVQAVDKVKVGLKSKGGSTHGFTPSATVTFNIKGPDTPDKIKTFDKKLLAFFKKYSDDNAQIRCVKEFFSDEKNNARLRRQFYDFMVKLKEGMDKKDTRQIILTIRVDSRLPGEREEYRELLLRSTTEAIGAVRSEGVGTCSLTFTENTSIYGRAGRDFPFYTIDKPGMITGGFREELAWRNFPVSIDGAQGLKLARDYLAKSQKFYMPRRFTYWVIPKFVFRYSDKMLEEMLLRLSDLSVRSPGFGLGYEASREFTAMEEDISLLSEDIFDRVVMTFLFYEASNAQLKIRLAIDDVPPSRLKNLIIVQRKVAQLQTYNDWIEQTFKQSDDKKSTIGEPVRFSFGLVWSFYERKAQKAGNLKYETDYLQFIRQLYVEQQPEPRHILEPILETLEALFKDPEIGNTVFNYKSIQAMCWIRYLCELGLWKPTNQMKGATMKLEELSIEPQFKKRKDDGQFENPWMVVIEEFHKEHSDMLYSAFLFGTFLLGCLVRLLMNIQAANINSTPFEKELKGLRLKKQDIAPLYSKTIAKLREYQQGNTYRVLDELISDLCLRETIEQSSTTHEEVSAYLAFGLAQGRVFKSLVDKIKKQDDNQD